MKTRPMLVHVHIPRTAGTAISTWLARGVEAGISSGHAAVYPNGIFKSDTGMREAQLDDPRIQTLSSHGVRTFPEKLADRRAYYFTVIREPFGQFSSLMRYMLQNRDRFDLPHRVRDQRDVARWYLDSRFGEYGNDCMQTNHLALAVWCSMTGRANAGAYALWSARDHLAYVEARLQIALSVLRMFFGVITFDRLTEGLDRLRTASAGIGIQLPPVDVLPFVNETQRSDGDMAWLDRDGALYESVAASLADDLHLYDYASRLVASPDSNVRPMPAQGERSNTRG